jgi:hypothetical protein
MGSTIKPKCTSPSCATSRSSPTPQSTQKAKSPRINARYLLSLGTRLGALLAHLLGALSQQNHKKIVEKFEQIFYNINMINATTAYPITAKNVLRAFERKYVRRTVSFIGEYQEEEDVEETKKGLTNEQIATVLQSMEYAQNTQQSRIAMVELSAASRLDETEAFQV